MRGSTADARVSTFDLELYRDGELGESRREAVATSLRGDLELRERLASVARIDACAKEVFSSSVGVSERVFVRPAAWLAAGALTLVAAVFVLVNVPRARPAAPVVGAGAPAAAKDASNRGYQVVFSIPINARPEGLAGKAKRSTQGVAELVKSALGDGESDEAAGILAAADRGSREAAYRHMGESIRTAEAAREAIAALSDQEKLEVCRAWADDPRLVPVAFTVLNELSGKESVAEEYREVVSQLRADPRLRGYVLSYLPQTKAAGL